MTDEKAEVIAAIALNKTLGYKPAVAIELIRHYGSAADIFKAPENEIREVNIRLGQEAISKASLEDAERELERITRLSGAFIPITSEHFPTLLKECPDPPVGLYYKTKGGLFPLSSKRKCISIVGTRSCTPYGRKMVEKIIDSLSKAKDKPIIISGLALGIDGIAHSAALDAEMPTAGVMATGIDTIYPRYHNTLAERICTTEESGLISDYPTGTAPLGGNFLRRNRIIAGLSDIVILAESRLRGGGMMTARLAYSYDREVYTLPGRVGDACSEGCNYLLHKKIAEPIWDTEQFPSMIGLPCSKAYHLAMETVLERFLDKIQDEQKKAVLRSIVSALEETETCSAEEISLRCGIPYSDAIALLGLLESEGLAKADLLQRYRLCNTS